MLEFDNGEIMLAGTWYNQIEYDVKYYYYSSGASMIWGQTFAGYENSLTMNILKYSTDKVIISYNSDLDGGGLKPWISCVALTNGNILWSKKDEDYTVSNYISGGSVAISGTLIAFTRIVTPSTKTDSDIYVTVKYICDNGDYYDTTTSKCVECPAGKYQPDAASSSCISCDAGTYSSVAGSTSCTPCPAGQYCEFECQFPVGCPAGTYRETTGGKSINDCKDCPAGTYYYAIGQTSCQQCPAGKYTAVAGKTLCDECDVGYYSNDGATGCTQCPWCTVASSKGTPTCAPCGTNYCSDSTRSTCMYMGVFNDATEFDSHDVSKYCYSMGAIIKPYTVECQTAYRSKCCSGSTKLLDCNYLLGISPNDSLFDHFCSACPFMDRTACPPDGVCWNDSTWSGASSPYIIPFTAQCLAAISSYCSSRLQANSKDPECGIFAGQCGAVVSSAAYGNSWSTFTVIFSNTVSLPLPDCNGIFNPSITPQINSGKVVCTSPTGFEMNVNVNGLSKPIVEFMMTENYFQDACGMYLPPTLILVTPPYNQLETLSISGYTNNKCFGLPLTATITVLFIYE